MSDSSSDLSFRSWLDSFLVDKPVTCFQDLLQRQASISALSLGCVGFLRYLFTGRSLPQGYLFLGLSVLGVLGLLSALLLSCYGLMVVFDRLPVPDFRGSAFSRLHRLRFAFLVFLILVPATTSVLLVALFAPFFVP